jgi:hypothetical protein
LNKARSIPYGHHKRKIHAPSSHEYLANRFILITMDT